MAKTGGRVVGGAIGAVLALGLCDRAEALKAGQTAGGIDYVSGGVGQQELADLHERRAHYSLWIVTAAARSGAYLADVHIVVRDAAGRAIFDEALEGPWLFIDLPAGRYAIEARLGDASQHQTAHIRGGGRHQVFFYFGTGDDVAPERPAPPGGNPYGGRPAEAPPGGRAASS